MTDPTRTFGDTHDNDDLHREPTTDALTDADALDALLNEIASGNGISGTRHIEPNVRSEDAASVMATAATFHRQVETAQGRDARAAGPDPQLWETIMERSGAASATPGVATAASPRRTRPTANQTTKSRRSRPVARRQHFWNMAANLGLVAAILLMAFGAWRFAGSPGLPGSGDGNGTIPAGQFAIQPATPGGTPESTEESPAVIPPVATPTPTTACDFSQDIPVFEDVDESPWDGTAVLLTTTGDIVLTCPEESEDTVLAQISPHGSVAPLEWPGAVLVPSYGETPEEARTRVVSLLTGKVVEFGLPAGNVQLGTQGETGSPWLVGPAPNDTNDVQILDLRTMETRLLSEIAGTGVPQHGGYLLSSSDDGSTLALALMRHQYPARDEGASLVTSGLPGDLLVLNGSLDAASWISVPDDFSPVVGFDVAPDGRHVALHGAEGQMSQDREDVYSLVRLRDGKEIERSSTLTNVLETGEGVWTQGGQAFAYIDGNALMVLPIDVNLPEQPVFEADGPLTGLRATADMSTLLVTQLGQNEMATSVVMSESHRVYAINTATRQATMFPGIDISDNVGWETPPDRFIVTWQYQASERDTITYQVIDVVTGETVGTLDDVPVNDPHDSGYPDLGRASVAEAPDGSAEIIAFDSQHTYLLQLRDGEYRIEQIAAPEGILAETPMMLSMYFAPGGSLVSMTGEGDESRTTWVLDVTAETPEWQPVTGGEGGYLPFVPGTGAVPKPKPDLGFDFSEVPDGSEFLDNDGLAAELRASEDTFAWPEGYDPDVEAMIDGIPADGSRFQAGMAYTMLGGYNECAWYQTWLDAHESGDEATEAQALQVMTDVIPYFPNHDPSPSPHLMDIAASAAEGDPDMVQQMVTVNCQGLHWEDAP